MLVNSYFEDKTMLDKNKLLEGIALSVDFDNLPPEQQKEILSYIEFIKNKKQKSPTPTKQNRVCK